jgi:2-keto-4-pentenoate hydratase
VEKRETSGERHERAARWLLEAHERREAFRALPQGLAPASLHEAYAVQDSFVALRAQKLGGIAGYKIALATAAMQAFVGVNAPQAGCILQSTVRRSPARIRAADYVRLIVEFEVGFQLVDDLPAADAPFSRERASQAIARVMPVLELADDRAADYAALRRHPLDLIADNTWNEGVVLGEGGADWHGIDLAAIRGRAFVNGAAAGEGTGADALGHPLAALAWIADHLASLGRGLLRGDIVITGSLVTSKTVRAGDRVSFALDGLGSVELDVE